MNGVHEATLANHSPSRRHRLSILFADLSGSTQLAAAMEAEHYSEMLAAVRDAYRVVVARHGGNIARMQGDGVLAIFGFPETREDDGRRAVEAALELNLLVGALTFEPPLPGGIALQTHSGVHSGMVLVEPGDLVRGRFELVGDPPNIAARLSAVAQAGEVVVSEETLGADKEFFHTGRRLMVELKGVAKPLAVQRVLARTDVANRFQARTRRGLTPLAGREREMDLLGIALASATNGKPEYIAVAGPAGIGKTRVCEEFLRHAERAGCEVHRGYCESYLTAEPLQPFLQILRSMIGMRPNSDDDVGARLHLCLASIDPSLLAYRDDLSRALSAIPRASSTDKGGNTGPENTVAALRAVFEHLAALRPIVVFIDDWQWADATTRMVAGALREIEALPLLFIATMRGRATDDARMNRATIVELGPLGDGETRATIARLLPNADPFFADRLRARCGGNPLFLEELCNAAAQMGGSLAPEHPPGGLAWLDTLIESRVSQLPAEQVKLIRAASVMGDVIPVWLLEEVTGYAGTGPLVRGLIDEDFLFPVDMPATLRFKHGITREAIYMSIGLYERKDLHRRVAVALRGHGTEAVREDIFESLAYHYNAGGQFAEAAQFAELAGNKALAASALDRAQAQYLVALAALDRLAPAPDNYDRWSSIIERLALACVFNPSREPLTVLRRSVTRAEERGDSSAAARAEYWLGYVLYALGDPRTAAYHCERALIAHAGGRSDPLVVQIRATLGQARAASCEYAVALPLLDEAIAIKRRHRSGPRPAVGLAYTLACKGALLGDRSMFDEADACFEEALVAIGDNPHEVRASVLGWRAVVYLWQGRWLEALASATQALAVAERVHSFFIFATDRAMAAFATWAIKPDQEHARTVANSAAWMEARDQRLSISLLYGWLAEMHTVGGSGEDVRYYAARAFACARRDDQLGLAMACRALARSAMGSNPSRLPQHYLDLAFRTARARESRHEVAVTQLCAAEIAVMRGQPAEALRWLDQAEPELETMRMNAHLQRARSFRAAL